MSRTEHPGAANPSVSAPPTAGPDANISLSGWKLSIPVKDDDGKATVVEPAAAAPPWLTSQADGSLLFWAPASGATTKNSNYPRTELNSVTNFTAGKDVHSLQASVTVMQEPQDANGIILGQIHGAGELKSVPFVMLHYKKGNVYVVVKQKQGGDEGTDYQLLNDVPLGSRFDFTITDQGDGRIAFSASRGAEAVNAASQIPDQFVDQTVRFQSGAYQLAKKPAGAADGAKVVFHTLHESHSTS